jgi:hypothetical protein
MLQCLSITLSYPVSAFRMCAAVCTSCCYVSERRPMHAFNCLHHLCIDVSVRYIGVSYTLYVCLQADPPFDALILDVHMPNVS